MSYIDRTRRFLNDIKQQEFDNEIEILVDTWNNHNSGTLTWDAVKTKLVTTTTDPASTPAADTIYKTNIIKGWVSFTSITTTTINGSFNVDSLTDNGTGQTTVTWDLDFADANYAAVAISGSITTQMTSKLAGSCQIATYNPTHSVQDINNNSVIAVGEQ